MPALTLFRSAGCINRSLCLLCFSSDAMARPLSNWIAHIEPCDQSSDLRKHDRLYPRCRLTSTETYLIAVHEIGHMLGLEHNPNPNSIMYFLDPDEPPTLDNRDLTSLCKRHKLRNSCSAIRLSNPHRTAATVRQWRNFKTCDLMLSTSF
jgi:hypothetical protein